jgi:hypothetical protein
VCPPDRRVMGMAGGARLIRVHLSTMRRDWRENLKKPLNILPGARVHIDKRPLGGVHYLRFYCIGDDTTLE